MWIGQKLPSGPEGLQQAFQQVAEGRALTDTKVTTLQNNPGSIDSRVGCTITYSVMYVVIEEKKSFSTHHHYRFVLKSVSVDTLIGLFYLLN